MADRLPAFLPRIAALVLVVLAATTGLTYAAGSQLGSVQAASTASTGPARSLVVPDVRNQPFVFAKGALEEDGFAWSVSGSVHGYAANVVVSQSPAPGSHVLDTGAPLVTVVLKRNGSYPQSGEAEDVSPYSSTAVQLTDLAGNPLGPVAPSGRKPAATAGPAATPATPVKPAAKPVTTATWPQQRPVAFVEPGARTEPLDEMPLPDRALALGAWLKAHPTMTAAGMQHWLYQNAWVVAGAKFGWWHGAEALKTLIAVDRRAQTLWGRGAKSAGIAEKALSEVQARSKS
jgi:beta-lactam-binding protein with PASTA domain